MSRVLDLWAGMTGTVLPFAAADAPEGWLLCPGQAVSRATYANLFAKIGTTFGVGDGSTTFNVPDLRGEFIRGLDNGRGVDSGRAYSAVTVGDDGNQYGNGSQGNIGTWGPENRPRNVAMNHIIKT